VYCYAVMDTFSRKIVGRSIDSAQDTNLVVNALDMAIKKPATKTTGRDGTTPAQLLVHVLRSN